MLLASLLATSLAGCQGASRSILPPQGTTKTIGDWEVTTSGRVRVDGVYVGE